MTTEEFIAKGLEQLRRRFYAQRPAREWFRDLRALQGALARYGYHCARNQWELTPEVILTDFVELLRSVEVPAAAYLPTYLRGCVDRRLGLRAEEFQRLARECGPRVRKLLDGIEVKSGVRPESPVESLARLERGLRRTVAVGRPRRGSTAARGQQSLF